MVFNKDAHSDHISQQFNQELETIKTHMMTMGGLVEKQLSDAIQGLLEGNTELAEQARNNDQVTNQWELNIEEQCTNIIARRQPAASDLRLIVAISRAVSDLERIGDEAARIGKFAVSLADSRESQRGYSEVRHISSLVSSMLHDALNAFTRYDTELAYQVASKDKEVDEEYTSAMRSLATYMMEDPRSITRTLNVIWVLRSLERVGDHSRNICQHLIYLVKGVNVSHSTLTQLKSTIEQ